MTEEELKDNVIAALKQLSDIWEATPEDKIKEYFSDAVETVFKIVDKFNPYLVIGIYPQPEKTEDIISYTDEINSHFYRMCQNKLSELSEGFERLEEADFTGIATKKCLYGLFPNSIRIYIFDPTEKQEGLIFSDHFISPKKILDLCLNTTSLEDHNSAWIHISLHGMDDCVMSDHPGGNSVSIGFLGRDVTHAEFNKLFIPIVRSELDLWMKSVCGRLERIFR